MVSGRHGLKASQPTKNGVSNFVAICKWIWTLVSETAFHNLVVLSKFQMLFSLVSITDAYSSLSWICKHSCPQVHDIVTIVSTSLVWIAVSYWLFQVLLMPLTITTSMKIRCGGFDGCCLEQTSVCMFVLNSTYWLLNSFVRLNEILTLMWTCVWLLTNITLFMGAVLFQLLKSK